MTPLVSVAIVIECETVLKREEHLAASRLDTNDVDTFLDAFVLHAEHVAPHFSYRPSIRDPDDEIFVSVSVNGRADALVTFNIADYVPIDDPTDVVDEAPRKYITAFETEDKDPALRRHPGARRVCTHTAQHPYGYEPMILPLPFFKNNRSMASSSKAWVVVSSSAASIFIWRTTLGSKWPPRNRRPSRDGR